MTRSRHSFPKDCILQDGVFVPSAADREAFGYAVWLWASWVTRGHLMLGAELPLQSVAQTSQYSLMD